MLLLVANFLFLGSAAARSVAGPDTACAPGYIPHSNVSEAHSSPCTGGEGTLCPFQCDPGFLAIGRHACQSYTTHEGKAVLSNVFFGGRCERLCPSSPQSCPIAGTVAVRSNTTTQHAAIADGSGKTPAAPPPTSCYATECLPKDEALRRLARGAYTLWRKGRLDSTGIYSGSVDPSAGGGSGQSDQAHIGINGVGLIFEVVAAEMGWQTRAEAATRVNLTLTALAGELPGFTLARQASDGWIPTFFNRSTGAKLGKSQPYTVLDSGLNVRTSVGWLVGRSVGWLVERVLVERVLVGRETYRGRRRCSHTSIDTPCMDRRRGIAHHAVTLDTTTPLDTTTFTARYTVALRSTIALLGWVRIKFYGVDERARLSSLTSFTLTSPQYLLLMDPHNPPSPPSPPCSRSLDPSLSRVSLYSLYSL